MPAISKEINKQQLIPSITVLVINFQYFEDYGNNFFMVKTCNFVKIHQLFNGSSRCGVIKYIFQCTINSNVEVYLIVDKFLLDNGPNGVFQILLSLIHAGLNSYSQALDPV